jgi:hypothetical protein
MALSELTKGGSCEDVQNGKTCLERVWDASWQKGDEVILSRLLVKSKAGFLNINHQALCKPCQISWHYLAIDALNLSLRMK